MKSYRFGETVLVRDFANLDDLGYVKQIKAALAALKETEMDNRAYSVLQVRSVDSEQRVISGWATTPQPDRVGDVIDPFGCTFADKSPLLWQHQNDKPVGTVKFGKATKNGLPFEAKFPDIPEAGILRDRVEEAWQSVKYGIITAVSVGFRALKDGAERMKDGGIRFTSIEVLELSLVSVPANTGAVITAIKNLDREHLPSAGNGVSAGDTPTADAVAPPRPAFRGSVKLIPRKRK